MPRTVRTARGEMIDFDAIVIKQQIASAPMNIDVARRKEFIDSKEGKVRGARKPTFIDGASEGAPDPNAFVTGEATRQVVINDAVSVNPSQELVVVVASPPAVELFVHLALQYGVVNGLDSDQDEETAAASGQIEEVFVVGEVDGHLGEPTLPHPAIQHALKDLCRSALRRATVPDQVVIREEDEFLRDAEAPWGEGSRRGCHRQELVE